nr:unnamed protein product [Digitaria exilis]
MDELGKEPTQSWPDLPPDLVGHILRLLSCHIDRLCFRSVCRHWRLTERQQQAHLPPPLPFIFLNNHTFLNLTGGKVRRVGEAPADDIVVHGCFDGWLLYGPDDRDTYDRRHKCFLANPLTGATVEMPLRFNDLAKSSMLYVHKLIVCSPDNLIAATCGNRVVIYWPDELFVHEVGDATAIAGKLPKVAAAHVVEQAIKKVQGPKSTTDAEDQDEKSIRRYNYLAV